MNKDEFHRLLKARDRIAEIIRLLEHFQEHYLGAQIVKALHLAKKSLPSDIQNSLSEFEQRTSPGEALERVLPDLQLVFDFLKTPATQDFTDEVDRTRNSRATHLADRFN